MSRLVLTGATGYAGGALLDVLEAHGELVGTVALCRRPSPELSARGVDVRVGALDDPAFLADSLDTGCRIIHMAGIVEFSRPDNEKLMAVHVEATRALAVAALEAGASRFVLLSTSGTCAVSRRPLIMDERTDPPMALIGRWPYYMSKTLQERLVLEMARTAGLPAVSLNPSLLLGPGDDRGGSTSVVTDFLARRLLMAPSGGISVVDVRDVAQMMRVALSDGRVGERYLLASFNGTFPEFFERLSRVSGVAAPKLPAPPGDMGVWGARLLSRLALRHAPAVAEALGPEKADIASHYWYVDWNKAKTELGFRPRPVGGTLADTVADLRARRALGIGKE